MTKKFFFFFILICLSKAGTKVLESSGRARKQAVGSCRLGSKHWH